MFQTVFVPKNREELDKDRLNQNPENNLALIKIESFFKAIKLLWSKY